MPECLSVCLGRHRITEQPPWEVLLPRPHLAGEETGSVVEGEMASRVLDPWSLDNESRVEEQEGGEEGDKGTHWGEGPWGLSPAPALPLSLSSILSCFFWLEEEAGGGKRRRNRTAQEERQGGGGDGGSLTGCRSVWERSRPRPPPFLQTWSPHPVRTCHPWSLRRRGGSSGLSPAFLPALALNVGRALQKEAWAGSQLGQAEPSNRGRRSLSPPKF